MRIILMLCCSLCFFYAKGQQKTFSQQWAVKLSPLAPFDPANPSLIAGLEYRVGRALGLQAEYGFKCVGMRLFDKEARNDRQYHKIKVEGRYYWPILKGDLELYTGVGYLYIPQRFQVHSYQYFDRRQQQAFQVDAASVRKNINSIMARAGFYIHFPNSRFIMEIGAGAGPQFVAQYFYNEINKIEIPEVYTPIIDWINSAYNKFSGRETRLNLEANFRIGWKLGKHHKPEQLIK